MEFFDTTLRDGTQSKGIDLSVDDKLEAVRMLDGLGIDYIELGWPGSSEQATEIFARVRDDVKLQHAKVVAFGSTRKKNRSASDDTNLEAIVASGADVACIFGKTWTNHVKHQLHTSYQNNLRMIEDSVRFLTGKGMEVFFDAEHFFDGYKENSQYALQCLEAAYGAGATRLVLCDTNGGSLMQEVFRIVKDVHEHFEGAAKLGIHVHNDGGLAVANSIIAAEYLTQIQGTINGFGERSGNADLTSIIPNLLLKEGYTHNHIVLERLKEVSDRLYEIASVTPPSRQPFVGDSAFEHKGGVHIHALERGAIYEHIDPGCVGNERRIVLSEQSGRGTVLMVLESLGYDVLRDDERVDEMLREIKRLGKEGYHLVSTPADQYLFSHRFFGDGMYPLDDVELDAYLHYGKSQTGSVVVKGSMYDRLVEANSMVTKDGPVSAVYTAMQSLVRDKYPGVEDIELTQFHVDTVDKRGPQSTVKVTASFRNGEEFTTVAVDSDIMRASTRVIKQAFNYIILNQL